MDILQNVLPLSDTGPYTREFGGVAPAASFLPKYEGVRSGPRPCSGMAELWRKLPGYGDRAGMLGMCHFLSSSSSVCGSLDVSSRFVAPPRTDLRPLGASLSFSGRCGLCGCYYNEEGKTLPGGAAPSEVKQLQKAVAATLRVIFGETGNPVAEACKGIPFEFDAAKKIYTGILWPLAVGGGVVYIRAAA